MIRLINKNDIDSVNELGLLIDKDFKKVFNIIDIINDKYAKIYIFEEDKEVIAFLHISISYEVIDIINIVVEENHRNLKVASKLMEYMFNDIPKNIQKFGLDVNVNNLKAINLYKKYGFKIVNTRKNYYGKDDAYLMVKEV
ncbi:MAG TPA: GNAT family N-acetyltransferase [Bacilli bacterium]|nr:GNAT family N-acetyltransferase [Bacilli bacterium]